MWVFITPYKFQMYKFQAHLIYATKTYDKHYLETALNLYKDRYNGQFDFIISSNLNVACLNLLIFILLVNNSFFHTSLSPLWLR